MLSTSINYCGKSRKFGDYISFIELKKGTKILYLEQFTQYEKQYEIVLPPECEFKYIGKNKGDEYIWECVKY